MFPKQNSVQYNLHHASEFSILNMKTTFHSGVTLLFEHLPSLLGETEHFEIFSRLEENQLAQQFFVKVNLLLFILIF